MKGIMNPGTSVNFLTLAGVVKGRLYGGDSVYGEVTTGRIKFNKVYRANGLIWNVGEFCTASTSNMLLTAESEPGTPPPPPPDEPPPVGENEFRVTETRVYEVLNDVGEKWVGSSTTTTVLRKQ